MAANITYPKWISMRSSPEALKLNSRYEWFHEVILLFDISGIWKISVFLSPFVSLQMQRHEIMKFKKKKKTQTLNNWARIYRQRFYEKLIGIECARLSNHNFDSNDKQLN